MPAVTAVRRAVRAGVGPRLGRVFPITGFSGSSNAFNIGFVPRPGSTLVLVAFSPGATGTVSSITGIVARWTQHAATAQTGGNNSATELWVGYVGRRPTTSTITVTWGSSTVPSMALVEILNANRWPGLVTTNKATTGTLNLASLTNPDNNTWAFVAGLFRGSGTMVAPANFTIISLDNRVIDSTMWIYFGYRRLARQESVAASFTGANDRESAVMAIFG